jgi:hypothetical protein
VQDVLCRAPRRRFQAAEQRVEPRELRHALLLELTPSGGRQRDLPRPPVVRRLGERRRAAAALDRARARIEVHGRLAGEIPCAFEGLGRQQDLVQECRRGDVLAAE